MGSLYELVSSVHTEHAWEPSGDRETASATLRLTGLGPPVAGLKAGHRGVTMPMMLLVPSYWADQTLANLGITRFAL